MTCFVGKLAAVLVSATVLFLNTAYSEEVANPDKPLRVGIYQNPPKIFREESGRPSGFWPELIDDMANGLELEIEYVDCIWSACLEMLETGKIDVMPDVAFSAERAKRFKFADHPVLYSWSSILVKDKSTVNKLVDLAEVRVAVVANSIQEARLREILTEADGRGEIIRVNNMEDTVAALTAGVVDAAIVNRFFAEPYTTSSDIWALDIPFRISSIQFAFSPNIPDDLIATFDLEIYRQRTDSHSTIYNAEHRWILEHDHILPDWVVNLLYLGGAILLLSLALISWMRRTIRERTQALSEIVASLQSEVAQRQQAEATAVEAQKIEALGRLVGGVAHDFNNLLAVILGNLELSKTEKSDTQVQQYLDDAISATFRGSELVKQLLSFGRRAQLSPVPVDLKAALPQLERLLRTSLPETIEIDLRVSPDLPPVKVDRAQFETALLNLSFNARDAMPEGGKLSISAAPSNRPVDIGQTSSETRVPREFVRIAVTDTGTGMDDMALERAFEPFFTTKPVGEGSGLGLAMVHGFAKQSNGFISIDSAIGKGTTVNLILPVADLDEINEVEPKTQIARKGPRHRIMLVEDEEAVRRTVSNQLEALGHEVTAFRDGDAAFNTLDCSHYDLVITDIVMPGRIQGFELAKLIREQCLEMPVIFMTGYASKNASKEDAASSREIRLMKPLSLADLEAAIQQVSGSHTDGD